MGSYEGLGASSDDDRAADPSDRSPSVSGKASIPMEQVRAAWFNGEAFEVVFRVGGRR